MKSEDSEELKTLIGKTIVSIRVSDCVNDNGFEIIFDDGTVLELYDIRCPKQTRECYTKKVWAIDIETGNHVLTSDWPVGGGLAFVISKEDKKDEESR